MSHESSSIEIEVYSDGKTLGLLKLVFFTYKGARKLQTSIMAYGSTPYVGMAPPKKWRHIKSAQMTRPKCLR